MGRKGKYDTHIAPNLKQIEELAKTMNDSGIATELGVSPSSFENYKNQYPELREAIREGHMKRKRERIDKYKGLLEKRAEGFHYKETKTVIRDVDGTVTRVVEEYEKYSPPDVGAIHLLLKNLDEDWTNDDKKTMDLKKEKLEIERLRTELNNF